MAWSFMRPKPRPPKPPTGGVHEIEAYRRYALETLQMYYKQICEELANTDPETLNKITEIVTQYEEVEKCVSESLRLMDEKINALTIGKVESPSYRLIPEYNPSNGNLNFVLEVVQ